MWSPLVVREERLASYHAVCLCTYSLSSCFPLRFRTCGKRFSGHREYLSFRLRKSRGCFRRFGSRATQRLRVQRDNLCRTPGPIASVPRPSSPAKLDRFFFQLVILNVFLSLALSMSAVEGGKLQPRVCEEVDEGSREGDRSGRGTAGAGQGQEHPRQRCEGVHACFMLMYTTQTPSLGLSAYLLARITPTTMTTCPRVPLAGQLTSSLPTIFQSFSQPLGAQSTKHPEKSSRKRPH